MATTHKRSNAVKMFVVRKYIMARSADEALKKERLVKADDVWIDSDWQKEHQDEAVGQLVGFKTSR